MLQLAQPSDNGGGDDGGIFDKDAGGGGGDDDDDDDDDETTTIAQLLNGSKYCRIWATTALNRTAIIRRLIATVNQTTTPMKLI